MNGFAAAENTGALANAILGAAKGICFDTAEAERCTEHGRALSMCVRLAIILLKKNPTLLQYPK